MLHSLSLDLYLWHIVETCTINTSSNRCYFLKPYRFNHVYFINQELFLLISTEMYPKLTHFSVKNYFDFKMLLTKFCLHGKVLLAQVVKKAETLHHIPFFFIHLDFSISISATTSK